jgi:hypothetical protein
MSLNGLKALRIYSAALELAPEDRRLLLSNTLLTSVNITVPWVGGAQLVWVDEHHGCGARFSA